MALRLFVPPRFHVGEREEHRKATWLELFYDLVYVATIVQLGNYLSDNVSQQGVLEYAALFIPIWWSWVGTTFYADRFDSDDVIHRVLVFIQMYTVGTMAIFVLNGFGEGAAGFALSYTANRVILIIMYIRAWQHVPEARALISRYAIGFSAAAGLWFISAFIPSPARFILWVAAMFIDFFVPFSPRSRLLQRLLPPSPHHLPERFALLTIIVFGESFLKIISGLAGEPIGLVNLVVNFPSLIIAGGLWWLYFDNVAESFVRWSGWNVQVWLYTHLPFQASVAALGVGMYKIITLDPAKPLPDNYRWLICIATALALIALGVIELTTKERTGERKGTFDFAIRVAGAILILVLGVVGSSLDEIIIMLFIALICAAQVVIDLYRRLLYSDSQMDGLDGIELARSD